MIWVKAVLLFCYQTLRDGHFELSKNTKMLIYAVHHNSRLPLAKLAVPVNP
jgi:hypothetical protein